MTRHTRLMLAGAVAVVATTAACGNVKPSVTNAGDTSGVYANRVVVGTLSSQTGPLPAGFAPVSLGAAAYIDMVNAEGGVAGRRIDLAYELDDQSSPSIDASQARALVDQDHVFAVVAVATPSFTGGPFLAANNVPTFGLTVNPQWTSGPSMFGSNGSYISIGGPVMQAAFLAEQRHVSTAAVLAYNVAQSQAGCQGVVTALRRFKIRIAYEDLAIPAPATNLSADVTRIKTSGAQMVVSCMDVSGNVLLSQTMTQQGVRGVTQLWNDGYDEAALAQYTSAMQGAYFFEPNVPFEVTKLYPGRYPGMDQFQSMLARYEPGTPLSEAALAGWTSADLFVSGLRAVGRDLTRSRLVAAINRIRSFTANGILAPVDWTTAHKSSGPLDCAAWVHVVGNRFVPVYGTPGSAGKLPSVFTCLQSPAPTGPPLLALTRLPAGVPPG